VNCRPYRELIPGLLDGALTPAERERLQEHLDQCPACRESLEELRLTLERIKALEPVEPPPWLAEKILARVRAQPPLAGRRLLPLALRPALLAACLLLVCLTGYRLMRVSGPPNSQAATALPAPPAAPPPVLTARQPPFTPPPPGRRRAARDLAALPPVASFTAEEQPQAPGADTLGAQRQAEASSKTLVPGSRAGIPAAPSAAPSQALGMRAEMDGAAARSARALAFRLAPLDPRRAGAQVEAALRGAGATILTPPAQDRAALSARVPAAALPALLRQLETLGTLQGPRPDPAAPMAEEVVVVLTW
jgi:hypothetical protein